jgi:hypothetical protein
MLKTNGQLMIEFFLYVSVFMFIVISGYFIVSFIQSSEISTREYTHAKEIGENFKNAITLAVRAGDGFTYNMTFPKNFLSRPYYITFDDRNSQILLVWEGSYGNLTYPFRIPHYNYTFEGCVKSKNLTSDRCENVLTMYNNGKKLIITQPNQQ